MYTRRMGSMTKTRADKIMMTRANVALTFVSINSTKRRTGNPWSQLSEQEIYNGSSSGDDGDGKEMEIIFAQRFGSGRQ